MPALARERVTKTTRVLVLVGCGILAHFGEGARGAESAKNHWAFRPVVRPPVPAVKSADWVRTPVDNFVLARLEREGLKASPDADRAILLRRVTFDLTGLPPTPAEFDSFLADKSPDAYEKRVDRLLAD